MLPTNRKFSGDELRIVYLAGPGDAPAVLRSLFADRTYDEIAHVAYSGQVFEVCKNLGAHMLSISTHSRLDDFSFGRIRAINIADPLKGRTGLNYHLGNWTFAKEVRRFVQEFNANVLITGPEPYPFMIDDLAERGIKLIPALHTVLQPEFRKTSLGRRLLARLSRRFYAKTCTAILSHPGGAVRQVLQLTNGRSRPIVEFLPLMRRDLFAGMPAPRPDAEVFRVMTVGRVEPDKGVFALIDAASIAREHLGSRVRFDVCGTGSALEEAQRRVASKGLHDTMVFHGWTKMDDMTRLWGESHLAVVPTTSDFVEGFNQVVIEATFAGRPVITSRVCPALEYVRPCAVEVDVDDVGGYARAIVELARDRKKYCELQSRTADVVRPFLDVGKSFGAGVEHVLKKILENKDVTPVAHPPQI